MEMSLPLPPCSRNHSHAVQCRGPLRGITLAVLALLANGIACAEDLPGNLLIPGEYHGNEVVAESGEQWLGLVAREDGVRVLMPVTLQVDYVFDAVLDEEGDATGKRVGVQEPVTPLFVVNNIPTLKTGTVNTAVVNRALFPGEPIEVEMGQGQGAALELVCPMPEGTDGTGYVPCDVVLRQGETSVSLYGIAASFEKGKFVALGDDSYNVVIWAGDLNADGWPDLLIDVSDHYNTQEPTLFLSPGDTPGGPPRKVARHYSVGC